MFFRKKLLKLIVIILFAVISVFFPYSEIINYSNGMCVTKEELNSMLQNNFIFTSKVSSVFADDGSDFEEYVIDYKLFNLFNIKKLRVNVAPADRYFAGGNSLGFSLQSKGVILIGGNYIISRQGVKRPFEESELQIGDIITHINNIEINNVQDISEILKTHNGSKLNLTVNRNGNILNADIEPALDELTNSYKLGIWVKEDAVGIGTLTFVNVTTNRFGSLGHSINDADTNECIEVSGGNIYKGRVLGVKKGQSGRAGELMGTFNKENVLGSIDKNCEYGVYGYVYDCEEFIEDKQSIGIGGRVSAKPGNAQILSCINGVDIESFDIEIIKTNFQSSCNEKSMVIRVVDKDLIARTGGIVQGMSGSPIIQDGKLIGAVTHVFVNDATKGFGIYIDWMLQQ